MRLVKGSLAGLVMAGILAMMPAPGLMGQTTVHIAQAPVGRVQVPRVQLNLTPQHTANPSNVRIAGFPSGPTQLPYPPVSTPANDAWARNKRMGCLQRKPAAHPDSRESKPVGGSPKPSGSRPFHPEATVFRPVQFPVQRQRDPVGSGSPSATGDLFRSGRRNSRT